MMTILFILLFGLCIAFCLLIQYNNKTLKHNQQLQHSTEFYNNQMNNLKFDNEQRTKKYQEKMLLLNNMQFELFQTYTGLIVPIHILQTRINHMQNKISALQSELHHARKRAKRLAKKADIPL